MFDFGVHPLELVARTAIVYVVFVAVLRVFGKRELGQFTIFDLALLLLAANALQPAMTGPDNSVLGGIVILATIFALNSLTAVARNRVPAVRRLLEPEPTVLARDGVWIDEAVKAEDLDQGDLQAALREHGIEKIEEARLVVLEQDGSISVVPRESDSDALRRRRRLRMQRAQVLRSVAGRRCGPKPRSRPGHLRPRVGPWTASRQQPADQPAG